jgi:PleD family two-component response regulator
MGGDAQFFTRTNTENTSLPTGCSQEREVWLALMGLASTQQFKSSNGLSLLAEADAALYVAKRAGRNQLHSAGPEVLTEEVDMP